MSAHDNLGAQWPNYQMAGSEAHDERGTHVTRYGRDDIAPISTFGIVHDPRSYEAYPETYEQRIEDVPLHRIRASQETVVAPHVRNLARVPADVMNAQPEYEIPTGVMQGENVILSHGHHRLAAAALRGDATLRVRVVR